VPDRTLKRMNTTVHDRAVAISTCIFAVLSACAVSYDDSTDQQITFMLQEGNKQLTTWENQLSQKQIIKYDSTTHTILLKATLNH
jgi:hypothetical protein